MWFRHQNYMGACFQASHATPRQWLMEMFFCTSETNVSLMHMGLIGPLGPITFIAIFWLIRIWVIHTYVSMHLFHFLSVWMPLISTFLSWVWWWGKKIWDQNLGMCCYFRHQNYMGACFQAPHCHTWTMTNGNALCSLISFVFQHIALTRSYKVMYQHVCGRKITIWIITVQIN